MIIIPGEIQILGTPYRWYGRDYHVIFTGFHTEGPRDAILDICDWGIAALQQEKSRREAGLGKKAA